MNLLAVLKENLTDTVVSRAAYYVDENPDKTRVAVEGLVDTIVAGLMKRTTTEIGVNQLYNAIQKGKFDGSLVASFPDLLRDPEQISRLADAGSHSISHLLPAMKSSIGTTISGYANIKNSAAITLLGLLTPLVLGSLNQLVQEKKLDADGLALLLADQREHLIGSTPERLLERMAEGLGIQQLLAAGVTPAKRTMTLDRPQRTVQEKPRYLPEPEEESNGSLAKWGIGVLVALALAGGAYYVWNNTQSYSSQEEAVSTDFSDTVAVTNNAASARPDSAKAGSPSAAPDTATISGTGVSVALTTYISDVRAASARPFPQPMLQFEDGTSRLRPTAQAAVDQLTGLMKNNPRLQIQLVGYANDARPPMSNKALSFERVNVIKQRLVQAGINYIRVDAIGRGTGVVNKPGDSPAVKKVPLRRIDIKVISK